MATIQEVIDVERNWIGYDRFTDPKHGTVFGRWMADVTGESWYGENGVAYCVMFQSYCFNQAGQHEMFFPSASCDDVKRRAEKAGCLVSLNDIRVGDLILFDWGDGGILDHIAIIEKVLGGGKFQTIEGNTNGGKVARRTRNISDIRYCVRPVYSDTAPTNGSAPRTKIVVDGFWGIETTNALRSLYGLPTSQHVKSQWDGWIWRLGGCVSPCWQFVQNPNGDELVACLQKTLHRLGYYDDDIDGVCGVNTINGLEKWMSVAPDGVLDAPSMTIRLLQKSYNRGVLVV